MRVTVVQYGAKWCAREQNIARLEQMLSPLRDTDLIVLPEMWDTGFVIEAADVAQTESESSALTFMKQIAQEKACAVVGSTVIAENGQFFNRCLFVTPDGIIARYDKRHLFRIGGETKRFTAGRQRVVVEWRGMRFLLLTCYDVRFPVFARNRGDYDAIICTASWPKERMSAWDTLARARAIENQCYVVAVNRIGSDKWCEYTGGSMVVNPQGETIISAAEAESIVSSEINCDSLSEWRSKFPTLRDSDDFSLYLCAENR